jgi:hypothetical protein
VGRQVRFGVVTAVMLAVLGLPLGWLWKSISPHVRFVVFGHAKFLADPEGGGPIGTDGRFAVIALVTGIVSGVVAYALAGRDNELGLLAGLGAGGVAGSLIAFLVGYLPGRSHFDHLVHTAADGRVLTVPPDLGAKGVLVIWPLLAIIAFALLEALDLARRNAFRLPDGSLPASDLDSHPADETAAERLGG